MSGGCAGVGGNCCSGGGSVGQCIILSLRECMCRFTKEMTWLVDQMRR